MKRGFVRLARLPDIGDGTACPRHAEERVESSPGLEKGNFCLGITSIAERATVLLLSRLWEKASVKSAGIGEGWGWGRSTCVSQEQNQCIRANQRRAACHLAGVSSEALSGGPACSWHKEV